MAITIKHLIHEARAQGCPSRLTVNGRAFKVEIINGRALCTIDQCRKSQVAAQKCLSFAQDVEELNKAEAARKDQKPVHIQMIGRALRQPRNEADVFSAIGHLLDDLQPTLSRMLDEHMFPQPGEAHKLRQLLHLNEHGTLPLAST